MTHIEVESHQKGDHETTVERSGEEIVSQALVDIDVVEKSIVKASGLEPRSIDTLHATDAALVFIAEETLESSRFGVREKDVALEDIAIEIALEVEQGMSGFDTPAAAMEDDGFGNDLDSVVERLHTTYATLPSGHEAAPLVMQAIDELTSHPTMDEPGEVEYVSAKRRDVQPTDGLQTVVDLFNNYNTASKLRKSKPVDEIEMSDQERLKLATTELIDSLRSRIANNKDVYGSSPQRFKEMHINDVISPVPYRDLLDNARWFVEDNTLEPKALNEIFTLVYEMKIDDQKIREESPISIQSYAKQLLEGAAVKNDIMTIRTGDERFQKGYYMLLEEAKERIYVHQPEGRNQWAIIHGYKDALHMYDCYVAAIQLGEEPLDAQMWGELYAIESMEKRYPDSAIRARANDYLNGLGINDWQVSRILQGMQGRIQDESGAIDTGSLVEELNKTKYSVRRIGAEGVQKLYDYLGIVNIGELNEGQQLRMVRFADGDPTLVEELQSKDVCVIFRDPTSDYNGALRNLADDFETREDSSLVFEPGDNEQMISIIQMLEDSGIRPSAYVIAGHGHPGSLTLGYIKLSTNLKWDPDNKMDDIMNYTDQSIETLFTIMKPDKDGVRNVILCSCSQGALYDGYDSTLSHVAKRVNEAQPGGDIHVYGTVGENNIRNSNGNLYDGYTKFKSTTSDIKQQPMTEVHVGVNGNVYMTHSNQEVYLPMFDRYQLSDMAQRENLNEVQA